VGLSDAGPKSDRLGRVQLNEWHLAEQLGVSNRAVSGMVAILVGEGRLRRLRHRGRQGLVLQVMA
jgi:hypothetical protein